MKTVFFQSGDFGEAYARLAAGGFETYRDQKASVDLVAELCGAGGVDVISVADRVHDESLAPGLRSIGIARGMTADRRWLDRLLSGLAPDRIVCRKPNVEVLSWAVAHDIPTLPVFADLFPPAGPRNFLGYRRLRRKLEAAVIPCVANHSRNASLSLVTSLGLAPDRVVPWDWSRLTVEPEPKAGPAESGTVRLFYAGMLTEAKGLGDLIAAVGKVNASGMACTLDCAGPGDPAPWRAATVAAGVAERVAFLGLIPHAEVRAAMRRADAVVVPSRHSYAEGLPNTIYEATAARTPLVTSDHPAFAGRLKPETECLVFPAGDAASLAEAVVRLASDRSLYRRLSENAEAAHGGLYFGVPWGDLIRSFVADPENLTGWVRPHALADRPAGAVAAGR